MSRINTDVFIKKAKEKWSDRYDYSEVVYVRNKMNVSIICKEHGVYEQRPDVHLKSGCKKCADDKKRMSIESFIEKASDIHFDKYNYRISKYESYNKSLEIICKKHGVFSQTPHNHIRGQGCPHCNGGISYNTDEFIKRSNFIHNYKYGYKNCVYKKANKKVIITCDKHGDFLQYPFNHINGRICPFCSNLYPVLENKWLDDLLIKNRQYKIGNLKVDGFDTETNTVYEFYGDFWHGNPKKYKPDNINPVNNTRFGELYEKTIEREEYLKSLGYKIVSIWESEYKNI